MHVFYCSGQQGISLFGADTKRTATSNPICMFGGHSTQFSRLYAELSWGDRYPQDLFLRLALASGAKQMDLGSCGQSFSGYTIFTLACRG